MDQFTVFLAALLFTILPASALFLILIAIWNTLKKIRDEISEIKENIRRKERNNETTQP